MRHLWNRLKNVILILIAIFTICFVISLLGNIDLAANISTFVTFALPIYLIYLVTSEIIYHRNLKRKSNNPINVPQTGSNNDKPRQTSKQKPLNYIENNQKEKHDIKKEPAIQYSDSSIQRDENNESISKTVKPKLTKSSSNYEFRITPTSIEEVQPNRPAKNKTFNIHHLRRALYNFVVVDCETTGLEKDAKIIQLSAIRYHHDLPVDIFNEYINPETDIPEKVTALTGIDNEMVKDAHRFSEISDQFIQFVSDLPWVGHNINNFDIPILINNGIQLDDFKTVDTLQLSRKKLTMDHYGLENLKAYYGIQTRSHNSLEDCKTTAIVYKHLRDNLLDPVSPAYSSISQTLAGKQFAISGVFPEYSRKDVEEMISSHGGIVKGISHRTDYLIDGKQISKSLTDGIHSAKELKAKEYGIAVLSLDELKRMMESN